MPETATSSAPLRDALIQKRTPDAPLRDAALALREEAARLAGALDPDALRALDWYALAHTSALSADDYEAALVIARACLGDEYESVVYPD